MEASEFWKCLGREENRPNVQKREEHARATWEFLVCVTAWMMVFLADKGHAEEWFLVLLLMGFNKVTAELYIIFHFISYFFMLFFFFNSFFFLFTFSSEEGLRASVV